MNEDLQEVEVLAKAADCFTNARRNLVEGAAYLYAISSQNLWRGVYSSFGEYVQQHCQISESFAAKLVKVHEYYVVHGQIPRDQLIGVDSEKTYLAMRLDGTAPEQLEKAKTWTRAMIRAAIAEDSEECAHTNFEVVHKCLDCGKVAKQ